MRHLLFALILSACRDPQPSSVVSPGVGGGGDGGAGAVTSAQSGESSSGETVGTTGAAGGWATSASVTTGSGGAGGSGGGGEVPVCEPVGCDFSPDATVTINCREDCGEIDARCATHVCRPQDASGEPYLVDLGVTEVLTPSLLEPDPLCVAECGQGSGLLWAIRLRVRSGKGATVAIDGPDGAIAQLDLDPDGPTVPPPPPPACDATETLPAGGCIVVETFENYLTLGIDKAHPTPGARFRIETLLVGGPLGQDEPPVPACLGGCSGDG